MAMLCVIQKALLILEVPHVLPLFVRPIGMYDSDLYVFGVCSLEVIYTCTYIHAKGTYIISKSYYISIN